MLVVEEEEIIQAVHLELAVQVVVELELRRHFHLHLLLVLQELLGSVAAVVAMVKAIHHHNLQVVMVVLVSLF
jgi:dethiobiotin synthetase